MAINPSSMDCVTTECPRRSKYSQIDRYSGCSNPSIMSTISYELLSRSMCVAVSTSMPCGGDAHRNYSRSERLEFPPRHLSSSAEGWATAGSHRQALAERSPNSLCPNAAKRRWKFDFASPIRRENEISRIVILYHVTHITMRILEKRSYMYR